MRNKMQCAVDNYDLNKGNKETRITGGAVTINAQDLLVSMLDDGHCTHRLLKSFGAPHYAISMLENT